MICVRCNENEARKGDRYCVPCRTILQNESDKRVSKRNQAKQETQDWLRQEHGELLNLEALITGGVVTPEMRQYIETTNQVMTQVKMIINSWRPWKVE